jgi:putative spermidine/putrescine transport system substrate-binding protein
MTGKLIEVSRRKFIKGGTLAAVSALAMPYYARKGFAADGDLLIVNSWGGNWSELEREHIFDPFTKEFGIKIELDTPVNFAKLAAQVQSGDYLYDVSSLNSATMSQARDADLLEPLDWSVVSKADTNNIFFEDYGVGFSNLTTLLAYRADRFPDGGPKSWVDFFDVERFPGARSMGKRAYSTLGFAMLGSGASMDAIYPFDRDAAYGALNRIRPTVRTWWEHGNESEQLLRDGEVDMMSIWNQRPQNLIREGLPIKIVWDGAEHVPGFYYAAKGTPRKAAAMQFLNFLSRPEIQAPFAAATAYAPTNPDALALMAPEVRADMSSNPEYFDRGFTIDANWVGTNLPDIEREFITWLATG